MNTPSTTRANLQGYSAILLWSFFALFVEISKDLSPFLLASLSSLVGFVYYCPSWLKSPGEFWKELHRPWQVWALFFMAIILYRGFNIMGLKSAPIIEANLLNYLWPILIVLFGVFIHQQPLSKSVVIGTIFSFLGIILIGFSKNNNSFSVEPGYILTILGACIWALYSVFTRLFISQSDGLIGIMHILAFFLFISFHYLFESPVHLEHINWMNWGGVVGMGLGVSLGYKLWDNAMTYGNPQKIAVTAYFTPLLSTLWLILCKEERLTPYVGVAAFLIISGSLLARLSSR